MPFMPVKKTKGVAPGQAFLTEMSQSCRASEFDWTSTAKDALLCASAGGFGYPPARLGLAPRFAGFGSCERQFRRREPTEPKPMSSLSIAKSGNLESTAPKKGSAKSNTSSRRKVPSIAATAKTPRSVKSKAERVAPAKHW